MFKLRSNFTNLVQIGSNDPFHTYPKKSGSSSSSRRDFVNRDSRFVALESAPVGAICNLFGSLNIHRFSDA